MSMAAINNNLLALNTSNSLGRHYANLAVSTQRLSSGLRINGAADDAAGLAIRELMRSDIAALRQGMRNVNDAISMIQTFDGALSVIDEKLIRMKELAEQAATGTYDSTQRLMIASEFQAMGSEIDRIANATSFNGVKLLCTKMITWTTQEDRFVITDSGSIDNVRLPAGKNGTPALSGVNANNYVNAANPAKTISVSLTATLTPKTTGGALVGTTVGTTTTYRLGDTTLSAAILNSTAANPVINYNGGTSWTVTSDNHSVPFPADNEGFEATINRGGHSVSASALNPFESIDFQILDHAANPVNLNNLETANNIIGLQVNTKTGQYSITRNVVDVSSTSADYTASYNQNNQTVTVNLANGGRVSLRLDNPLAAGDAISFDINFEGETKKVDVEHHGVDPNQKVKIHFGPENNSAEDYYYIKYANCTMDGLGLGDVDIETQQEAQEALVKVDDAIVQKDKVRAELGSMQNRLENTMTNLSSQEENLQAAESRISDADIAREMMFFVRNQILTQSATAMLAQANMMPQMVMRLVD